MNLKEQRSLFFEKAKLNLKETFLKYPICELDGCPHCAPFPKKLENPEDYNLYLRKAMTTWGTEEDFKARLPILFEYLISGKRSDDNFWYMERRLEYVTEWGLDERKAISDWLCGYLLINLINKIEDKIDLCRENALKWLIDINHCFLFDDFPLSFYLDYYPENFLNKGYKQQIVDFLLAWPKNDFDYIYFAHYLDEGNYYHEWDRINDFMELEMIDKQSLKNWLNNIEKNFEKLFWLAPNENLQHLFSDANRKIHHLAKFY